MEYCQLGKSALQVSRIGFGCMSLEEDYDKARLLLHKAMDKGINFFDTADIYQQGLNEEMLGKALIEKRKNILIASKVGNQLKPGGGLDWNPTKKHILTSIEKSLQRLQTDYIDLYQLHGGTIDDPIDETIEAFELLQQQGKIRYYGISSIRPNVIREYAKRSNMISVMMQYSLLDRRPEEECLSLLHKHSIGVLARGTMAKGLLAGKPATDFLNYTKEETTRAASAIKKLSSGERSVSQSAIQFVLKNPAISSAITGIRTIEQLEDISGIGNSKTLTDDEMNILRASVPVNYYDMHR